MKLSLNGLNDPWRRMIAVNAAIMIGFILFKAGFHFFGKEYIHLVIDYHFGVTKRALVGQLLSFAFPVVPYWLAPALGVGLWLVALALFLRLFDRTFGFDKTTLPLFVLIFGSPVFFKNYIHTLSNLDIYGCIVALIFLLAPARSFLYVACAAVSCIVLILIHHIHMLLFVPTIIVIVISRYYFSRGVGLMSVLGGLALASAIGWTFIQMTYFSNLSVSVDELTAHMKTRAADPDLLELPLLHLWYRPLSEDIALTWWKMPNNMARMPIYAALIALHWPLIAYCRRLISALAGTWRRRLMILGFAGVTLGYVIMAMFVHDYARWFSNWAVCMVLLMHAVKMLPTATSATLIPNDTWTRARGWIATVIPRVGTTYPF